MWTLNRIILPNMLVMLMVIGFTNPVLGQEDKITLPRITVYEDIKKVQVGENTSTSLGFALSNKEIKRITLHIEQDPKPKILLWIFGRPDYLAIAKLYAIELDAIEGSCYPCYSAIHLLFNMQSTDTGSHGSNSKTKYKVSVGSNLDRIIIEVNSLGVESWKFLGPVPIKSATLKITMTIEYL